MGEDSCIDLGYGTGKVDEGIKDVEAGARHSCAGRLTGVVPPTTQDPRAVLVTKVALNMQDAPKDATCDNILERSHRGKVSLAVTKGEDHTGVVTSRNGTFRLATRERQRLLAPNSLAGPRNRNNLIDM